MRNEITGGMSMLTRDQVGKHVIDLNDMSVRDTNSLSGEQTSRIRYNSPLGKTLGRYFQHKSGERIISNDLGGHYDASQTAMNFDNYGASHIRGYKPGKSSFTFKHGVGYDYIDGDLLGGNGNGKAHDKFNKFVRNDYQKRAKNTKFTSSQTKNYARQLAKDRNSDLEFIANNDRSFRPQTAKALNKLTNPTGNYSKKTIQRLQNGLSNSKLGYGNRSELKREISDLNIAHKARYDKNYTSTPQKLNKMDATVGMKPVHHQINKFKGFSPKAVQKAGQRAVVKPASSKKRNQFNSRLAKIMRNHQGNDRSDR